MVFVLQGDSLKEDLKRLISTKENQSNVKHKKQTFEPEPFNEYKEEFYETKVQNYKIDDRFDKPNVEKGARRIAWKQPINYPNLKKDVKAWSLSCC
jgi:hypothetical protein